MTEPEIPNQDLLDLFSTTVGVGNKILPGAGGETVRLSVEKDAEGKAQRVMTISSQPQSVAGRNVNHNPKET